MSWNVIFVIVSQLIAILAIIHVVLDNRQPAKTLAWALVIWFVPVAGVVFYLFFGINTRKERYVSERSMNQLTKRSMLEFVEQQNLRLPEKQKPLIDLFINQNLALPFKDNEVGIYTDGYQFFHALLRDMAKAKHHIHIDSYIFNDDELGNMIADALIDKAKEHVEVRVIYDDVGCWDVKGSFFERMRDAGIEVHGFMPVKFPAFTSKVNYRNHRKLCVIDGKIGFIGGMNIATRYVRGKKKRSKRQEAGSKRVLWRDTHLRIQGGGVYGIQRAFLVDWYFVDRTLISDHSYYPPIYEECGMRNVECETKSEEGGTGSDCIVQIVTSSPISEWPDIMQGYIRILLEAKKYVYIETPYFLPTEPVLLAMRTAALTGVDVRVMIPYKTDAKLVEWASRSYVHEVVSAGVKIYLYQKGFNHSKLLVSDDSMCTVGSSNVDFRSFENNFEGNAFIYDRDMALRMKEVYMNDVKDSVLLDDVENLNHRPFLKRLWESVVRLLSPLL